MKQFIPVFFLILLVFRVSGQEVEIPESVSLGGLHLNFTNSARKILKTEVENLRRNPKYFQMKVERANLYFPLIEKVFELEGFPKDFKYLALQESSLVPDAVSSSNAVGYWQFKKESAQEVGVRVDNIVDERMNIFAATRGAAKYLTRNNAVLKNWVYALLSYNMGLGGVRKEVNQDYIGATSMRIDDSMHWYVLRFLAHKFAFENEIGKTPTKLTLLDFHCKDLSLAEIAKETQLSEDEIATYNKWLLKRVIPDDKEYVVILPVRSTDTEAIAKAKSSQDYKYEEAKEPQVVAVKNKSFDLRKKDKELTKVNSKIFTYNNKIRAVKAKPSDTYESIAATGGIKVQDLLLYNEIKASDKISANTYYYFQSKRNKALSEEHVVKVGENIWLISQEYGMRMSAIRKKNKLKLKEEPKAGTVLLLRRKLKKGEKLKVEAIEEPKKIISPEDKAPSEETKLKQIFHNVQENYKQQEIQKEKASEPTPSKESFVFEEEPKKETSKEVDSSGLLFHTVAPGETLYSISKKYNVKTDSIVSWNNLGTTGLKSSSTIIVGKKIAQITSSTEEEVSYIYHVVQPGETLYKVARQYNKTVADIQTWNNKKDANVSVGEKLKIQTP